RVERRGNRPFPCGRARGLAGSDSVGSGSVAVKLRADGADGREQVHEIMQLKGYFSGTVEAAMELARKELGEDALLANARPAAAETRYLGSYEVVFGVTNGATTPRAPGRPPGAGLAERPADSGGLAKEFAELKREFQKMAQKLELETPTPAALANTPSDPLY